MFGKIAKELKGIRAEMIGIKGALRVASDALRETPAGSIDPERFAALEGRVEVVSGEVAAGIIKSEALKATARAAEDRARGHQNRGDKAYELAAGIEAGEEVDPFEQAGELWTAEHPGGNGEAVEEVPTLPTNLEARRAGRAYAKSAKRRG